MNSIPVQFESIAMLADSQQTIQLARPVQVYGPDSVLCQKLANGQWLNSARGDNCVSMFLKEWVANPILKAWLADRDHKGISRRPHVEAVAETIAALTQGAADWISNRESWNKGLQAKFETNLRKAWEAIERSFPDEARYSLSGKPKASSGISRCIEETQGETTPTAYWIVRDFLEHLCSITDKNHQRPSSIGQTLNQPSNSTITENPHTDTRWITYVPVVFVCDNSGHLMWLVVELFRMPEGDRTGAFTPQLEHLGLTDLGQGPTSFFQSTQIAWKISGLRDRGWRGHWRLSNSRPEKVTEMFGTGVPPSQSVFPAGFDDHSIGAAFLCALIAASGDPYAEFQETSTFPPHWLVHDTVISAALVDEQEHEIGTTRLAKVDDATLPLKYRACQDAGIERFLLRAEQAKSFAGSQQGTEGRGKLKKPAIIPVTTIANALDEMLVENRWLKRIHEQGRTDWLGYWRFDQKPEPKKIINGDDQEVEVTVYRSTGQSGEDDEDFTFEQVQELQAKANARIEPA